MVVPGCACKDQTLQNESSISIAHLNRPVRHALLRNLQIPAVIRYFKLEIKVLRQVFASNPILALKRLEALIIIKSEICLGHLGGSGTDVIHRKPEPDKAGDSAIK
jgi:hypothetical protein